VIIVWALLLLSDQPPSLIVREPLTDGFVTASCKHPLDVEAWAPAGITRLRAEYQVLSQNAKKPLTIVHEFEGSERNAEDGSHRVRGRWTLDLSALGLAPGDIVKLRFRAESRVTPALSREISLSVVGPETLEKHLGLALGTVQADLAAALARQENALESARWPGEEPSAARLRKLARDLRSSHERAAWNGLLPQATREALGEIVDDLNTLASKGAAVDLSSPETLGDARKAQGECRASMARALDSLRQLPR
jgi:hypothetical protein